MKRPNPIAGFLIMYFAIIGIQYFANQIFFSDVFTSKKACSGLSLAIAQSSLTGVDRDAFSPELPLSYFYFSLTLTQLMGLFILSLGLWYYVKLFPPKNSPGLTPKMVFKKTISISLISEFFLFVFFMYAVTSEPTGLSLHKKCVISLTLAIHSFNNAGLSHLAGLIPSEIIQQQFALQIGIVAGSTLGHLGIFVLYELFSPNKLRERLEDHSLDWSFITKITFFGTAFVLILFSTLFLALESGNYLQDQNAMESVIASIYEINSARGFGFDSATDSVHSASLWLKLIVSIAGSGPFANGGGLTLLCFVSLYSFFRKGNQQSANLLVIKKLFNNLVFYSMVGFGFLTLLRFTFNEQIAIHELFMDQVSLFVNTHITMDFSPTWPLELVKGLTIVTGRMGFLVACFLTLSYNKN